MKRQKNTAHSYFNYCGKFKKELGVNADGYHLLPYHCLDVAATAEALLRLNKSFTNDIATFLQLSDEQFIKLFCFFITLHDLGKFSSAFQGLFPSLSGHLFEPNHLKPYNGAEYRHDRLGYFFWRQNKEMITVAITSAASGIERKTINRAADSLFILMEAMLGHHGKPINKNAPNDLAPFMERGNEDAVKDFIQDVLALFEPAISIELLVDKQWQTRLKQISWHGAGLAVLADWLGSNNQYFPYHTELMPLEKYWAFAQKNAQFALESTDLWQPLTVVERQNRLHLDKIVCACDSIDCI